MHLPVVVPARPLIAAHRVATAGIWFVAAWLVGLFVAPSAPAPDAASTVIAAHFADHGAATAVQSLLIHGIAGVALLVLVVALAAGRSATLAGVAAAVSSLLQAAVGLVLPVVLAEHAAPATAAAAFDTINTADTVKLVLLAVFVTLASRGMGARMRIAGYALAPLLVLGGAFVTRSDALYATLYVALPALLAWVAVVAYRAGRAALAR